MSWFSRPPDPLAIHREAAIGFLRGMERRLSADLSSYITAIQRGQMPQSVMESFGTKLADRLDQHQSCIAKLEGLAQYHEDRAEMLVQEIAAVRSEPIRQMLGKAQQQIRDLSARIENDQRNLAALQHALEVEQSARQREVDELQSIIAGQNRIIAKQQVRLNNLAGKTRSGEPPSAETPEIQS